MKPWPLYPAAHQKPSTSGIGPRMAWWSGVDSYRPAHAVFIDACASFGARTSASSNIRAMKSQLTSVLYAGPSSRSLIPMSTPSPSG